MAVDPRPLTWLERNENWAMPMGCLFLGIVLVTTAIAVVQTSRKTVEFEAVTEQALDLVENHPEARRLLGEDFQANMFMGGKIDGETAEIVLPVRGHRAEGQLELDARRDGDDWHLEALRLQVGDQRLEIPVS